MAEVTADSSAVPQCTDSAELQSVTKEGSQEDVLVTKGEAIDENATLLSKAEQLYDDDKLLEAGRILRQIDQSKFESKHETILQKATKGEELVKKLKSTLDGDDNEWVIHGVSKGEFPTLTAHRLDEVSDGKGVKLTARCETPVDKSLLSPFLSVLNETELYETWLPSWNVPRFKVTKCKKLSQRGRCSQVLIVTFSIPWPMASREVVLLADGIDDIDKNGDIAIRLRSLNTGDEDNLVPPSEDKSTVRVDIDGGFLICKCPNDHPALLQDQKKKGSSSNDDKILITFAASMDPKMKLLPQSFLNFLVKVAFAFCWSILLKIARDVQNGKREDHKKKIAEKREVLYDWVESRLKEMLSFGQAMST